MPKNFNSGHIAFDKCHFEIESTHLIFTNVILICFLLAQIWTWKTTVAVR